MLLEELLGISNKRLKAIFEGKTLNEDSSSTDEEEQEKVDVISLDDITDDDFIIIDSGKFIILNQIAFTYVKFSDDENNKPTSSKTKIKTEHKRKKFKKEKPDKEKYKPSKSIEDGVRNETSEQNLMSVLELLELQARARAIRSQLALESSRKAQEEAKKQVETIVHDNDEDAVIVETQETEIIISSSDSENEASNDKTLEKTSEEKSLNEIVKNNENSNDSSSNLSLFSVYDAIDSAGKPRDKQNKGNEKTEKVKVIQNVVVNQNSDVTRNNDTAPESLEATDLREEKDNFNQKSSMAKECSHNSDLCRSDAHISDVHLADIPLPKVHSEELEKNKIKKVNTSSRKFRHKKHLHSHGKDSTDEDIETKRRCHKHRKIDQSIQDKKQTQYSATNGTENDMIKSKNSEELEEKCFGEEVTRRKKINKEVTGKKLKSSKKVEQLINKNEIKTSGGDAEDNNDSIVLNMDQFEMDCIHLD